ncbi:MAG: YfhO family protein, partial [Chloroflexales bacterium]|nr:YfhO family protein [Chloroflexales bacterium]
MLDTESTSAVSRQASATLSGRSAVWLAAAPLLIFLSVALACGWYLQTAPFDDDGSFAMSSVSTPQLDGLYGAETNAEGRGYRWTDGDGSIELPAQSPGQHVLAISLSAPRPAAAPVPVALSWNGAPMAEIEPGPGPRRYSLLMPAAKVAWGKNSLGIASPTFRPVASDLRELGVAVFTVTWHGSGLPPWLPLAQAATIASASTALYLLLRRAGIPAPARLLTLGLLVAILISMRHSDPRFVERWHALLITCGLGLLAAAGLLAARPQPGDGPLPWRAWARLHWPALAGYTALTAVMLWPVLASFSTQIPGHPGDAFEYLWKLQLFSDYLVGRHQSPAFLPWLMYPEGFELANSEITPANTLLGLPITWRFGPIASFNALNLASYVLSGFFSYLLIHRLGARRLAAFVGGIVFAFTVRRYFQMSAGHLPLMPTQYLPLALYGLEGMLTRRRSWDAFVAALGLALATWASLYYGTTLVVFMAGYALLRTGLRPLAAWVAATWRPLALASVVLLALVAPFAQPYLEIREQGATMKHDRIQLELHSAQPSDYLLPNPFHPLLG